VFAGTLRRSREDARVLAFRKDDPLRMVSSALLERFQQMHGVRQPHVTIVARKCALAKLEWTQCDFRIGIMPVPIE
jgi:hypothetical protein